jgi:hypothetical protein
VCRRRRDVIGAGQVDAQVQGRFFDLAGGAGQHCLRFVEVQAT